MIRLGLFDNNNRLLIEKNNDREGGILNIEDDNEVSLGSRHVRNNQGDYIKLEMENQTCMYGLNLMIHLKNL